MGAMATPNVHHEGTAVWVADPDATWVKGIVKGYDGDKLVVSTVNGDRKVVAPEEAPVQNKDDEIVDDMTDLAFLHEPGVLWNLKQRYAASSIYTYTGSILIAVNPFRPLPQLFQTSVMDKYSSGDLSSLPPHVYAVASAAYKKMRQEGKGQAILVTGESGAGKTETSKLIMRYLAYLGGFKKSCWDLSTAATEEAASSSIEQKVLESNPLLEAFGNAKTVRNDNSSRFGKYVEINFNARGAISGAAIRTYLLERSRLVHLNPGERNYHIFYQLCDGASPEERSRWLLADRSSYTYLNQSGVYDLPGVDNATEFQHTRHAMSLIGITVQQQEDIFQMLSALLHLGNISWEDGSNSSPASNSTAGNMLCNGTAEAAAAAADAGGCPLAPGAASPAALAAAAKLIGVDITSLARALSTRTRMTPDGPITSPLDAKASASNRDALVKVIYARLFDWLVAQINKSIGQDANATASIGLLDIYGFESFQFNDLEQFCINLANEKLQQHFNQHVFKWEQAEYEVEGIDWSYIEFVDNQDVLDLIEGKLGIVDQLDEQCRFPTATHRDLADKLFSAQHIAGSSRFSRTKRSTTAFTLSHYAGPVSYSLDNFLDKNKDFVVAEHQSLMAVAAVGLISQQLFAGSEPDSSSTATPQNGKTAAALSGKSLKAFQFVSVCSHFKRQLAELMTLLNQLEPHYVRCIKPNPANKPLQLDDGYALHQLKCGGVMEAVRISCAGYPFRRMFAAFLDQFWQLYPAGREAAASGDAHAAADACKKLLATTGMKEGMDYQVGLTKVFLKAHQSAMLNKLHTIALAAATTKIQAAWRCYKARKEYSTKRAAIITLQAGTRGMFARRRAASIRQERAATCIQALWRGAQARTAYTQLQQAALMLQAAARGAVARKAYQIALAKRRTAAATVIQALWRGLAARQQLAAELEGVLALQAAWRGLLVRQQFAGWLQQHRAACRIQQAWRRYVRSKQTGFRCDAAAQAAAVVIQTIWREREQHNSKVRRLQSAVRQYTALHRAAVLLQCAWRNHTALQLLKQLELAQRRERFKQQKAMFEQQMAAAAASGGGAVVLSPNASRRSSSRGIGDGEGSTVSQPGVMPPPQKAAYGVTFAGLAPRSPSPSEGGPGSSSSGAPARAITTTTSSHKLRVLPPPPPAAYGVSYAGINGDINPYIPGEHLYSEQPTKPRGFKLFSPPPTAAYGVSYSGYGGSGGGGAAPAPDHTRARLLEPAPPASYGVSFAGLQSMSSGNSSISPEGSVNTSSSYGGAVPGYRTPSPSGSTRLFQGLKRLGSSSKSKAGGEADEQAPLLDVVKADESSLLPPEDRLFHRLGSLVEDKGKVTSAISSWKDKLRSR